MSTENKCVVCFNPAIHERGDYWFCVLHAAEHDRALAAKTATEPPKPPYGWRYDDDEKAPHLVEIDPGPGYRLLREDELLPDTFEAMTLEGWKPAFNTGGNYASPSDFIKDHPTFQALRVPREPVITDAACKNCDCWLVEGWNYCPYCSTARNPEFPKPISDLSGLPESGNVLAFYPAISEWLNTGVRPVVEHGGISHWTPMLPTPPAPVPPPKSQMTIDLMAYSEWCRSIAGSANLEQAFRAGIAHARKQGEGK